MRLTALLVLVLLVSGCGGADGTDGADGASEASSSSPAAVPTAPAITNPQSAADSVSALSSYLAAYLAGRAEQACALQTPSFTRDQVRRAVAQGFVEPGSTCAELVARAVAVSRRANPSPVGPPVYEAVAVEAAANLATVRVDYPGSGTPPDSYRLVRVDGRWLVDADLGVTAG